MRSVVKHKYIAGGQKGKAQAHAHLNYIQHRDGPDREEGPRPFFDQDKDKSDAKDFKEHLDLSKQKNVLMHKLILSPGCNGVDLKEYTREIMAELADVKGYELEWQAVIHTNTDHEHVHVVVMGKTQGRKMLNLKKADYDIIRAVGDRYLERKYEFDRYCDKTMDRIIQDETRHKDIELEKLLKPYRPEMEEKDKKKGRRGKKDKKEEKSLYADRPTQLPTRRKPRKQRLMENRGRSDYVHDVYVSNTNKVRLEQLKEARPELAPQIDEQLLSQKAHDDERRAGITKQVTQLERILGIRTRLHKEKVPDKEKYKTAFDRSDIDLSKVARQDKILLKNGDILTKYDSLEYLTAVNQQLKRGPNNLRLNRDDYNKMSSWMNAKNERGDAAFGDPALISREQKELKRLEKLIGPLNESLKGLDPVKDRDQILKIKTDYFERMFNPDSKARKLSEREQLKEKQRQEYCERQASSLKERLAGLDKDKDHEQIKKTIAEYLNKAAGQDKKQTKPAKKERQTAFSSIKEQERKDKLKYEMHFKIGEVESKDPHKVEQLKRLYNREIEHPGSTYLGRETRGPSSPQKEYARRQKELVYELSYKLSQVKEQHKRDELFAVYSKDLANLESTRDAATQLKVADRDSIDLSKVSEEDKITLKNGQVISKYDSQEFLKSKDQELRGGPKRDWLGKDDYSKMWHWIGTKEKNGDDCYGSPPQKDKEQERLNREDIDLSRVASDDKITLASGEVVSKYDNREFLLSKDNELREGPKHDRLSKEDYSKMWQWIGTKEKHGDDCYGTPPQITRDQELRKREDIDLEKVAGEDKITLASGETISKYDNLEFLMSKDQELRDGPNENRLAKEDYSRMWKWIGSKESFGEDHYGKPPIIGKEQDEIETPGPEPETNQLQEKQEVDRINKLTYEMVFEIDQLHPVQDHEKINELRSNYMQEICQPGSTELAPVPQPDGPLTPEQKDQQENDRVNSLMYQLHYREKNLDPETDNEKLAELRREYLQEMNNPGSTSFAPVSEQPPSKEEREQAEAIQKQELEKSRIEQLTEKLTSILAKLDMEKDGERIQQTLERALAIADDPTAAEGIKQAASWKLKEQEEVDRISKLLETHAAAASSLNQENEKEQIADQTDKFWENLFQAEDKTQDKSQTRPEGEEKQEKTDTELPGIEERHDQGEEKKQEAGLEVLEEPIIKELEKTLQDQQVDFEKTLEDRQGEFEKVFQQLQEMLEKLMREEQERKQKELEEQEKEEREKEKGEEREEEGEI